MPETTSDHPLSDPMPDSAEPAMVQLRGLNDMLGYKLRRAQLAVFQDFHRTFADLEIRPAQLSVLVALHENPGLRQSQVADALAIKRANFVALFDTLESRGLATRERVPDDRRAFALHLTAEGEKILSALRRLSAAHEQRLTERLGDADRAQLLSLLDRLVSL